VIRAVLFDLDDTLYAQAQWLYGAWRAVADAGAEHGADRAALFSALIDIAGEGSDRGRIIDRALERTGPPGVPVEPLVEAFRAYRSDGLQPYPGVVRALEELRSEVPIGLVTDGDVTLQADKLAALGLESAFDAIVFSDAYGREFRKPHPLPFRIALAHLDAPPECTVVVGDRPDKDVEGAVAAGCRPIRVRTGEYRGVCDSVRPWYTAESLPDAVRVVLDSVRSEAAVMDEAERIDRRHRPEPPELDLRAPVDPAEPRASRAGAAR
jgi:putative hydrolase of the HAD superfamily